MSEKKQVKFTIDGKECVAEEGATLLDAALDNDVFIPGLCHIIGEEPAGSCRLCNVKVDGKIMTACTTKVYEGMEVENNTKELNDMRKAIVEVMFTEGNHFCPACEKSGNCQLQAMAYKMRMQAPRFEYEYPNKKPQSVSENLMIDHNRCILCKRCVRSIKSKDGKAIFQFSKRAGETQINVDEKLAKKMTKAETLKAMSVCPVGAILSKRKGFSQPIGKRKYDEEPIDAKELKKHLSNNYE